jgi:hypothetical protein
MNSITKHYSLFILSTSDKGKNVLSIDTKSLFYKTFYKD